MFLGWEGFIEQDTKSTKHKNEKLYENLKHTCLKGAYIQNIKGFDKQASWQEKKKREKLIDISQIGSQVTERYRVRCLSSLVTKDV